MVIIILIFLWLFAAPLIAGLMILATPFIFIFVSIVQIKEKFSK